MPQWDGKPLAVASLLPLLPLQLLLLPLMLLLCCDGVVRADRTSPCGALLGFPNGAWLHQVVGTDAHPLCCSRLLPCAALLWPAPKWDVAPWRSWSLRTTAREGFLAFARTFWPGSMGGPATSLSRKKAAVSVGPS